MELDLKEIYQALASYRGLPFPLSIGSTPKYFVDQWKRRIDLIKGADGRPLVCPVTLKNESTNKDIILGGSEEKGMISIQPAIQVEGALDILKTKIEGSAMNGTVKENIGFGDYNIRIFGVVVNRQDQKQYPYDQVQILKNLWKLRGMPIGFDCEAYRGLFTHVVLTKFRLDPLLGRPGIQAYEFRAISDEPNVVELLSGE